MGITAIICIAAIVLVIIIVLTILLYNMMLLVNEVNKRLLLITKESIDKERSSQEELQDALIALEQMSNEQPITATAHINESFDDNDLDI
jgi:predicted Holliday junction resolvase-like endonuclease